MDENEEVVNFVKAWQQYVANVLPHALGQTVSFVLACVAHGANLRDDDDDTNADKVQKLRCSLQ